MTPHQAWQRLLEEAEGDPSSVDVLDFIASHGEGWMAHVASMGYMLSLGATLEQVAAL